MDKIYFILIFSVAYMITPPKNGGAIPERYLELFKNQQIVNRIDVNRLITL